LLDLLTICVYSDILCTQFKKTRKKETKMITHTNAIVKLNKNRFEQGVIFDNQKFVAGHYDAWSSKFSPAIFGAFECQVGSIEIVKNAMDEDVAIVTQA
jgi:hypothetical protein